ncbi:hypothetical protein AAVH_27422 [Aphelenchoides avenae]|nr:hypothetical protein AAVH_27422 [Aphelenchus avenae]
MQAYYGNTLGSDQIASLANLATDCGDVLRIDVQLKRDDFAECLTKWIEALVVQKQATKLVNNVAFHCNGDAVLPDVLGKPLTHLPKRKWPAVKFDGERCEMEDIDEKSVFAIKNENFATDITAVVARYGYVVDYKRTKLTCNFFLNPSEKVNTGDFSQGHIGSTGMLLFD